MDGIKIRSLDNPGWYWIRKDLIEKGYGAKIGPYGIAVYNVLAYYSDNKTQSAWPSFQTIADKSGMSRRKAIEVINQLEKLGLIYIERRGDKRKTNKIWLLAPDQWTGAQDALVEPASAQGAPDKCTGCTSTSAQGAPEQDSTTILNNKTDADVAVVGGKNELNDQQQEAMTKLETIGVQPKAKAKELARDYDPDVVIRWCEYAEAADWAKNPAGYVVKQLQSGTPPPIKKQPARRGRPCHSCHGGTWQLTDPDTGEPITCPICGGSGRIKS
jgi:hypothetical protein